MHANEAAHRLMRETSLVRVENGMLRLPAPQMDELLGKCMDLEQTLKSANAETPIPARFHTLPVISRSRGDLNRDERLYAFFSMLAPQDVMGSFGLRPIVLLFFYHPLSVQTIDSDLLYAAFGLTPAECRVATLLAEGLAPKEIADELGTRHDTVRKQLRAIYQKTSTNRQPDLIRLLLNLPHNAVA